MYISTIYFFAQLHLKFTYLISLKLNQIWINTAIRSNINTNKTEE